MIGPKNRCIECGSAGPLHEHHLMNGVGIRKKATEDKLTAMFCVKCHRKMHDQDNSMLQKYKKIAQRYYEQTHTREQWMARYHFNYLWKEELNETETN